MLQKWATYPKKAAYEEVSEWIIIFQVTLTASTDGVLSRLDGVSAMLTQVESNPEQAMGGCA